MMYGNCLFMLKVCVESAESHTAPAPERWQLAHAPSPFVCWSGKVSMPVAFQSASSMHAANELSISSSETAVMVPDDDELVVPGIMPLPSAISMSIHVALALYWSTLIAGPSCRPLFVSSDVVADTM